AALSNRFFTLMVFIHIAVPLIMLFLMWVHIQRYARPRMNPPRELAAGSLLALVVLSLVFPAVSQAPANLDRVVAVVDFDWFYLAAYPLLDVVPGGQLWLILIVGTAFLAALPWLPPLRKPAPALVDLENCNGCGRCADDCPFDAIEMGPRTDGASYDTEAVVNPTNCVSCGICAGACPTSTPHRRATSLVPGIELPGYPIATLRDQTRAAGQALTGENRVMVFGCERTRRLEALSGSSVATIALPCVGMLPPSFIDWVLARDLADGVMVSGCAGGDCYQRLGQNWTHQRVARERDPYLRARVPDQRVQVLWTRVEQTRVRERAVAQFRNELPDAPPLTRRAARTAMEGSTSG
nr:4Fe-4S binding protein [Gammaproteobacteria bacterium]